MKRKWLISLTAILGAICIWQWELISYGLRQAKGQIDVIRYARPVDEFLADPEFPDSLKQKLALVAEARTFAIEHLGLINSDNYTTMYDQKGQTLLWNLSASEPYELKAYKWWFPFLGSMPYKGFFELEDAKKEKEELDVLGYDTRIRPVGGWSTLGILSDPILSNMLRRSDGALAELIIHELTHSTIFIKNEVEFNENLASFIGERGAELFLTSRFGDSSEVYLEYIHKLSDQNKLIKHMLGGSHYLEQVYEEISEETDSVKATLKKLAIEQIVATLDTVSFSNERYKSIYDNRQLNNANFMSYKRYHSQEDTLNTIYSQYDFDLLKMLEGLKQTHGKN